MVGDQRAVWQGTDLPWLQDRAAVPALRNTSLLPRTLPRLSGGARSLALRQGDGCRRIGKPLRRGDPPGGILPCLDDHPVDADLERRACGRPGYRVHPGA